MATAKSKTSTTNTPTTKQGQKAKQPAPVVRPAAPKGWECCAAALTAVKAGAKPSQYYPQGNATIKLLPKGSRMGANQQKNWDAIHAALGGMQGGLAAAVATENKAACTRRHVRRLARAGYLVWQAEKA